MEFKSREEPLIVGTSTYVKDKINRTKKRIFFLLKRVHSNLQLNADISEATFYLNAIENVRLQLGLRKRGE